ALAPGGCARAGDAVISAASATTPARPRPSIIDAHGAADAACPLSWVRPGIAAAPLAMRAFGSCGGAPLRAGVQPALRRTCAPEATRHRGDTTAGMTVRSTINPRSTWQP